MPAMGSALHVSPEVERALAARRPVVALETTLVTHGLPHPHGLEAARAAEAAVREAGAVPATVGVRGGRVLVGLAGEDLEALAGAARVRKVGAGDLAAVVAQRLDASTTVSATVWCAARAGIRLVATGGIGGVHRGGSGDVSHDLAALAAAPVAVVSSGAKAILDLPRTVELLETLGVPIVGLGTAELPAFYTRETGIPLETRAETAEEVAALLAARWQALGQAGGVLVANPPPDALALARDEVEPAVERALGAAAERGVRGKALTPFLLAEVAAATGLRSVAVNRALIVANARAAAEIARAYHSGGDVPVPPRRSKAATSLPPAARFSRGSKR